MRRPVKIHHAFRPLGDDELDSIGLHRHRDRVRDRFGRSDALRLAGIARRIPECEGGHD